MAYPFMWRIVSTFFKYTSIMTSYSYCEARFIWLFHICRENTCNVALEIIVPSQRETKCLKKGIPIIWIQKIRNSLLRDDQCFHPVEWPSSTYGSRKPTNWKDNKWNISYTAYTTHDCIFQGNIYLDAKIPKHKFVYYNLHLTHFLGEYK